MLFRPCRGNQPALLVLSGGFTWPGIRAPVAVPLPSMGLLEPLWHEIIQPRRDGVAEAAWRFSLPPWREHQSTACVPFAFPSSKMSCLVSFKSSQKAREESSNSYEKIQKAHPRELKVFNQGLCSSRIWGSSLSAQSGMWKMVTRVTGKEMKRKTGGKWVRGRERKKAGGHWMSDSGQDRAR